MTQTLYPTSPEQRRKAREDELSFDLSKFHDRRGLPKGVDARETAGPQVGRSSVDAAHAVEVIAQEIPQKPELSKIEIAASFSDEIINLRTTTLARELGMAEPTIEQIASSSIKDAASINQDLPR